MKKLLSLLLLFGTVSFVLDARAQQSQDFGEYVVHYNALNTNMIPPQVAQSYNIKRSPNRALLNVTVLKKMMDTPGTPVKAGVSANGTNLTLRIPASPLIQEGEPSHRGNRNRQNPYHPIPQGGRRPS